MKHINVALFVVHEGCPNYCSFCNQRSISGVKQRLTAEQVDAAVATALESNEEQAAQGEIAFFGGSFTMIERSYMLELLSTAKKYIDRGKFRGIRISTRPDGIDAEICSILKEYGVTSVELGAQSMDDEVLIKNRRGHTAKQVADACAFLHSFGFEVGLQMMTGLYGSRDEDCILTAEKLIKLSPASMRIYPTVVLEGTELAERMRRGEYTPQSVESAVELCARLLLMFDEAEIPVIRLGLHSGKGVEDGFLAGAYHPALREKCESRVYRELTLKELGEDKNVIVAVNKSELSKFIGQKRENIEYFNQAGYTVQALPVDFLKKYEIKVYGDR